MPPASFLSIDLFRRFELRLGDFERLAVLFHRAEKARLVAFVAGRADLVHLDQQCIAVAIERDVLDRLRVAALLAFHPEFLARTAPEMRLAGFNGFFERGAVHPRHHHDAAGFLFLNDGWNQAVRIKFQFVVKAHGLCKLCPTR